MRFFLKAFDENIGFPLRQRELTRIIAPHLKGCKRVLDLGSSNGQLAKHLKDTNPHIQFIGADTHVPAQTYIPVVKYDGKTLPFKDNSFDCVIVIDVLHHDTNPEQVLREAKRVSRKLIIIKDHYWNNKFELAILKIADYIGNRPYGIKLPYNFLQMKEWHRIIKKNGLRIISTAQFKYSYYHPANQLFFKLEKQRSK